ncbi:MAG: S9 family peptidase [Bacteroidales bacterium]|nr:S9 family peptidase [Candidatus Cacconaster merdequi]
MKHLLTTVAVVLLSLTSFAQKPAIDHSVYDSWKSIGGLRIQDGGNWATFTVSPQEGDAVLHVYNVRNGKEYLVERASQVTITKDATKAIFRISPSFQQTRQAKIDKKTGDEAPKDSLGVMDLATGKIERYEGLKSMKTASVPDSFVAFQKAYKGNDTLYVLDIKTFRVDSIASVESFSIPEKCEKIAYVTKVGEKDSTTIRGVFLYDPAARKSTEVMTGEKKSVFSNLNFSKEGDKLVFFANPDTVKDAAKRQDMYLYEGEAAKVLLKHDAPVLPKGWKIGEKRKIGFQDHYLTFGTMPVPREKDTSLVDFEQAKLDIWTWNEDYIQPVQKNNLARDKERTYLARIGYDGSGFAQLGDELFPDVSIPEDYHQDYVLETCDKPYRISTQWESNTTEDLYKISLKDGSRRLLMEGAHFERYSQSPDGKWYVAFNAKESNWYLYSLDNDRFTNLTANLGVAFYDEEDDHPMWPGANGTVVWAKDSRYFLIRDRYDYWQFDPSGAAAPAVFTEGKGRSANVTYTLIHPVSTRGETAAEHLLIKKDEPVYFITFNHTSKEYGIARKDITRKGTHVQQLAEGPCCYGAPVMTAGKNPVALFNKGNFESGNNLWMTKDMFKSQKQLTDINPQQRDYNWGTVELVNWNAADGTFAEGLLFKPEDFDASKKYPVIIYFYERYSDDLYQPRNPAPSASTVNIPYFVSNGYICFIPDIRYTDGHPGKSCMNYLMPACDMLCSYPWIDGDNMAIQGQSWGGYQVAYVITQTNRFKAAGAGAPVSNMTSAYGGIRWESGRARTMQYERGQSRIGKDLWEGFDLYVENSPLFHVPDVTTPVLIMHNDQDGAVPWWQGIEFFNGLRRCGKQAWMLQYNDEAHNLKERRNRKDLSIRLEQFFGHFLKGEPMPVWMSSGVPATLKGIDYGFEKDENTTE